mmetsp:Transcript_434/g.1482  ORF Transcript_434/g.1482 Transcript_434/m.1482 type:complete len:228 (-) Transcript_434:1633-2316(-)
MNFGLIGGTNVEQRSSLRHFFVLGLRDNPLGRCAKLRNLLCDVLQFASPPPAVLRKPALCAAQPRRAVVDNLFQHPHALQQVVLQAHAPLKLALRRMEVSQLLLNSLSQLLHLVVLLYGLLEALLRPLRDELVELRECSKLVVVHVKHPLLNKLVDLNAIELVQRVHAHSWSGVQGLNDGGEPAFIIAQILARFRLLELRPRNDRRQTCHSPVPHRLGRGCSDQGSV